MRSTPESSCRRSTTQLRRRLCAAAPSAVLASTARSHKVFARVVECLERGARRLPVKSIQPYTMAAVGRPPTGRRADERERELPGQCTGPLERSWAAAYRGGVLPGSSNCRWGPRGRGAPRGAPPPREGRHSGAAWLRLGAEAVREPVALHQILRNRHRERYPNQRALPEANEDDRKEGHGSASRDRRRVQRAGYA